ncbi:hypothetical protein AN958_11183 [Leucoagaricus sp. SymC.cos]|nr:hypothetical protein AN958_11183 [Leucoagaricus sp. SymC.cos]
MASASQVIEIHSDTKPSFHPLFNDEDAEIILSSNESMRFRLPRFTLKKASDYFRNIFANKPVTEDQHHVIPFPTEPVEHVLFMISPLPTTSPSTFDKIEAIINVMQYLDTQGPLNAFRQHVLPVCYDKPVKLYELGVKLGWPELEQRGAELTFPINLLLTEDKNVITQLSQLSGPVLLKLL